MKIKKLFGIFLINWVQVTLGVFALIVILQSGIYILGGENVGQAIITSFLTASFLAMPIALEFCFPLFIYSVIKKEEIPILKNRFVLIIIPISYLFIRNILYSLQEFWGLFENTGLLSIYANLMIFNFLFIVLYFVVLELFRSCFHSNRIKILIKLISIFLLVYLFLGPVFRGSQLEIFTSNTKAFDEKIESLSLTPEEGYEIIFTWTEKNDPPMYIIDHPRYIIDDYYYYPPLRKITGPLFGYYVHGNTGKLEFRESNHIIKGSFLGITPQKIPANIFNEIEVLEPEIIKNN